MPILSVQEVATKFKETWMMCHPEDRSNVNGSVYLDDSLTSLQWLQDFSIQSATLGNLPSSSFCSQQVPYKHPQGTDSPASPPAGDTAATCMPRSFENPVPTSALASRSHLNFSHQEQASNYAHQKPVTLPPSPLAEVDYRTNPLVKPPYSYATLICMAMQANKKNKIALSAIYNWITENFCYYRHADPSWQNSIRHNLSLNKCFIKVPRQKDEPGKGGFWQIDPQYANMFVNGIFKRRRMPASHVNTHRHSSPWLCKGQNVQDFAQVDYSCRGPVMEKKHKQPTLRHSPKWAKISQSPPLTPESNESETSKGDPDWGSMFDDVLMGNNGTFEDFDLNTALNSLGCGVDPSQECWRFVDQNKWCLAGPDQSSKYMEMTDTVNWNLEEVQHQQLTDLQQPLSFAFPCQSEDMTLFSDQQIYPLEEIKEEMQAVPISSDHSLSFCDGVFNNIQSWERPDSYV
ncbi:forkhead box protein J1-B-like [Chanos chanos]|uniref:Forkhead box protein J1-B-like n=1 Tax=Chanos chanos TaxID=29144 RepID=A0A6J2WRW2_CHACN|nr:forkhead box protein J1-B-like [Chanos chanos]